MNEAGRGEHATFRELKASEEALDKRMRAIELEQAAQRAALMHLPDDVRQLTQAVNAMAAKLSAPQADHTALALQRLADEIAKDRNRPSPAQELVQVLKSRPTGWPWLMTGVAAAMAAMLGWANFTG